MKVYKFKCKDCGSKKYEKIDMLKNGGGDNEN